MPRGAFQSRVRSLAGALAGALSDAWRFGFSRSGLTVSHRLLLIIAACLLPALGLQVAVSWSQLSERRAQLGDLALHQAELLGGTVDSVANGARILLGAAAGFNQVRTGGGECGARLAGLRQSAPGFAFIALVGADGRVTCASDPALLEGGSPWLGDARAARAFSAGRFTVTARDPGGILPFHLPFAPRPQEAGGTLVAGLDLDWLAGQLSALKRSGSPFLASGVLTVADADGVILARDVRHAEFVGRRVPPDALAMTTATVPGILRITSVDGTRRLIGYTPPTAANLNLSAVVGFSEPELMGDIEDAVLRGVLLMASVSVVVFILTLLAARRFITRPTRALLAAAEQWRRGNLDARAPDCGPGSEFGQLATAWNTMAAELREREAEARGHAEALERRVEDRTRELVEANARLSAEIAERRHTEAALLQAQKVQAVGQLAGGIAHDFNNVLQAVLGGVSLIRRRAADTGAVQRLAGMVEEAARRGESVTRRLLAFSRREELRADALDIGGLLDGLREVLTATLGAGIRVEVHAAPDLPPVLADRGQLETVLVNLATNARDAMPGGGGLTLSASLCRAGEAAADGLEQDCSGPDKGGLDGVGQDGPMPDCLAPGRYVRIRVADTGEGMSADTLARAAEAFFTTKPLGQGTGLGLAMARSFAKGSGGAMSIVSAPQQGTAISIWLPVVAGGVDGALDGAVHRPVPVRPAQEAEDRPRRIRILLVDDEPMVRDVLAAQLDDAGFDVTEAGDGRAALERMPRAGLFDVLVTDLAMPGLDGVAVILEARRRQPGLPAILLTGYAGEAASLAVGSALAGAFTLLRKPVTGVQLADHVAALAGLPGARAEDGA